MSPLWSKLKKGKAANVGDEAPDFSLPGTTGGEFRLSDARGKQRVLLLFYPQDFTSG